MSAHLASCPYFIFKQTFSFVSEKSLDSDEQKISTLRSASMTKRWCLIRIQSTRQVRVHMKATMNSQTLMMKMKRGLMRKAVLVPLKKTNQRLQDQTHLGNQTINLSLLGPIYCFDVLLCVTCKNALMWLVVPTICSLCDRHHPWCLCNYATWTNQVLHESELTNFQSSGYLEAIWILNWRPIWWQKDGSGSEI